MSGQFLQSVALLIPMILSLTVHEYSHARVASALRDHTAENLGRLTLNPLPHIDPIGTVVLPLIGFMFGGFLFGWARPVPVNPINFTRKVSMKTGMLLVAAAGPLSNLLLAGIASLLIYVMVRFVGHYDRTLNVFFSIFIRLNIILAFFNLLPVPPLDGGRILTGLLPSRYESALYVVERYGFVILIFLLFSNALSVLFIPANWLSTFLLTWPLGL